MADQDVTASGQAPDTTLDRFLDGRVAALQPRRGRHRAGTDAVLLAASVPVDAHGTIVDLGAGVGVAGLCVARLRPAVRVVLVDCDTTVTALANDSLALAENGDLAARVSVVEADILAREAERVAAGLLPGMASHVIMNPPFHEPGTVRASPDAARAFAHVLSDEGLEGWMRTAASLLAGGGRISVIWPADRLSALLVAMEGRFGGLGLYPLFPAADRPAIRVLASGIKGSRGPLRLMPGLVLHDEGGRFSPAAERAMRAGELIGAERFFG